MYTIQYYSQCSSWIQYIAIWLSLVLAWAETWKSSSTHNSISRPEARHVSCWLSSLTSPGKSLLLLKLRHSAYSSCSLSKLLYSFNQCYLPPLFCTWGNRAIRSNGTFRQNKRSELWELHISCHSLHQSAQYQDPYQTFLMVNGWQQECTHESVRIGSGNYINQVEWFSLNGFIWIIRTSIFNHVQQRGPESTSSIFTVMRLDLDCGLTVTHSQVLSWC